MPFSVYSFQFKETWLVFSCTADLVVMNFLSFCVWEILHLLLILNDKFAKYNSPGSVIYLCNYVSFNDQRCHQLSWLIKLLLRKLLLIFLHVETIARLKILSLYLTFGLLIKLCFSADCSGSMWPSGDILNLSFPFSVWSASVSELSFPASLSLCQHPASLDATPEAFTFYHLFFSLWKSCLCIKLYSGKVKGSYLSLHLPWMWLWQRSAESWSWRWRRDLNSPCVKRCQQHTWHHDIKAKCLSLFTTFIFRIARLTE